MHVSAGIDLTIILNCILVAALSSEYLSDEVEKGAQKRAVGNRIEGGGIKFFLTARKA